MATWPQGFESLYTLKIKACVNLSTEIMGSKNKL
ncbi:hypothetical protein EMIT0P2_40457 [Pseudomonas sp. IT-P2]